MKKFIYLGTILLLFIGFTANCSVTPINISVQNSYISIPDNLVTSDNSLTKEQMIAKLKVEVNIGVQKYVCREENGQTKCVWETKKNSSGNDDTTGWKVPPVSKAINPETERAIIYVRVSNLTRTAMNGADFYIKNSPDFITQPTSSKSYTLYINFTSMTEYTVSFR